MPNYTENLNLFKYDVEKDGKSTFNVGLSLNDNFDKIDEFSKNIDEQKQDVATAVKCTENVSVGGIAEPIYVDAYGNAKSTNLSIANERFDGQWVSKQMTLSTATAVGTYEIDLSDYLPNDNYNYEVQFIHTGGKSDTSGSLNGTIYSDLFPICQNALTIRLSTYTRGSSCGVILPVKQKVHMQIYQSVKDANLTLVAIGYRRIGINT